MCLFDGSRQELLTYPGRRFDAAQHVELQAALDAIAGRPPVWLVFWLSVFADTLRVMTIETALSANTSNAGLPSR